jgi:nitroreductase
MISHEALHKLMSNRRSVRRFRSDVPDRRLIESILASATTAPSASNKQPWRFFVVQNREKIDCIATAVRAAVERIALAIEPQFEDSFRAYGDYFTRFENAPVVIVPLYRPLTILSNLVGPRIGKDDEQRIHAMERDSGLIGTSLAIQNLLLAAYAAGLAASGMTGPLVAVDAIREILRVPPSWQVVALIPIGFPDEEPGPTARKPVEQVTQWIE